MPENDLPAVHAHDQHWPEVMRLRRSDISNQGSDYRVMVDVVQNPSHGFEDSLMIGYRWGTVKLLALPAGVSATPRHLLCWWTEQLTSLVYRA
jgi:hypothetical protein